MDGTSSPQSFYLDPLEIDDHSINAFGHAIFDKSFAHSVAMESYLTVVFS
jgi:hypothetical protein